MNVAVNFFARYYYMLTGEDFDGFAHKNLLDIEQAIEDYIRKGGEIDLELLFGEILNLKLNMERLDAYPPSDPE
jgi:hypothetical protein